MVVTLFLLIVIGLLIGAAIKTRMEKIGFDRQAAWSSGRSWWEVMHAPSRNYSVRVLTNAWSEHNRRYYQLDKQTSDMGTNLVDSQID